MVSKPDPPGTDDDWFHETDKKTVLLTRRSLSPLKVGGLVHAAVSNDPNTSRHPLS